MRESVRRHRGDYDRDERRYVSGWPLAKAKGLSEEGTSESPDIAFGPWRGDALGLAMGMIVDSSLPVRQ